MLLKEALAGATSTPAFEVVRGGDVWINVRGTFNGAAVTLQSGRGDPTVANHINYYADSTLVTLTSTDDTEVGTRLSLAPGFYSLIGAADLTDVDVYVHSANISM